MMPAVTHMHPVLGVDIHIIQPPGPVPPVPIPHPYVGIVFDPADYMPVIGSTVSIHGLPRGIAGTASKAIPPHIPIGGVFVKPPVGNEAEIFMGSSTVSMDGDAASFMALPALSCQDVGIVAPVRSNPKKVTKTKSMVLPLSVVLAVPAGPPVLIGGPPTVSLMSLGMRAGMAGLGRGLRRLAGSKLARRAGEIFKKARQRSFRNMKAGFLKCAVLRAEPVDVVTGEVVVEQQDFSIPGRIPLEWNRCYGSRSERVGICGHGWETPADARLVFEPDETVTFYDGTQAPVHFESVPESRPVREKVDGGLLQRTTDGFVVVTKEDREYHFALPREHEEEALIASIRDPCGNSVRFERDENGLRAIVEDRGRRIDVISVGGLAYAMHLVSEPSASPHPLVQFEYGPEGKLLCVRDALHVPYRFDYQNHRLVRHTDRNGLSFHYEYDEYEFESRCVRAWGDGGLYDYRFRYHPHLGRTEYTDSLNHDFAVEYDNRLLITHEEDPLGGEILYEYDDAGRTTAVVDPDENRTEYAYDERGNLRALTRPDGCAIATAFNDANRAVSITDPNGAEWRQDWDGRGLLTRQVSPLGAESRYEYDRHGQLLEFANPRGARTLLGYDRVGNLTWLKDALGHVTRFRYDVLGNVTAKTDPLGHATHYAYDPKGRLICAALPSGAEITCAYDGEDNLIRYQDENGEVTGLEYFGLGEIRRRMQPDGESVEYEYDTEERLVAVVNQRGERYELRRDPLGRIEEEVDYWGQGRRYAYTAGGYLAESVDPLGRTIKYETDPLGRILKKTLPDPTDPDGLLEESFEYDGNGNLTVCENAATRIERRFDAESRLLEERQGEHCTVINTYDKNGNRIARTTRADDSEDGYLQTVRYGYDDLDQAVTAEIPGHAPLGLERNAMGQVTRERLSETVTRDFGYSADGYLTAQQVLAAESPVLEQTFRYDRAGNLLDRDDSVFGIDRYVYDPIGRLTAHLRPEGRTQHYLNDPAGDRLRTRVVEESAPGEDGADWGREGEHEETFYRFDRAGNLVTRRDPERDTLLAWDANQRLVESETNGSVTRYGYDPLGRRVSKETEGAVTRFFWDGDALLGDLVPSGAKAATRAPPALREWIYYPETFEPLAMLRGLGLPRLDDASPTRCALYLYHNDPNGCPTRMLDALGNVVWAARYGGWGDVIALPVNRVDNPLRLQGQYADGETGLRYNRHRYYDASVGQFVSEDPVGLWAGENNYQFAPSTHAWLDPLGLSCRSAVAKPRELFGRQGRAEFSGSQIKRLKKDMKKRGFDPTKPIDVVEVDGRMIILDGHHRARAAGAAKISEVPVRIHQVDAGTAARLHREAAEAAENLGLSHRW